MLIDLEKLEARTVMKCDVCVIGSGAVGLVVAVNLASRGRRVVLLEGGGVGLEQRSQDLYRAVSVGHPFKGLDISRFRVLGGTTTFWGGQVIPLDPIVFEERPWLTAARWPITKKELDPYFFEAYRSVGLGNVELDDTEVWRLLGVQPLELAENLELVLTRWIPKRNFARLFKRNIDGQENLKVVVHANMTHFSTDESGERISEIHARTIGGKKLTVQANSAVLTCGAIENARLLLQPLCGSKRSPWGDNRWVGRGYVDHLDSTAGTVRIVNLTKFHSLFDTIHLGGFMYYPKIRLSSAAQRQEKLIDIAAHFSYDTRYADHLENIKMFCRSIIDGRIPNNVWAVPNHILSVAKISYPLVLRYLREHRSFKPSDASVRLELSCEQIPIADSVVRQAPREVDALGMCCAEIDWKINGAELKTFATFARRIRDGLKHHGLAEVELDSELDNLDPAFFSRVHDANHQMSTTRMAPTAKDGVVDANLRVYGTSNLYVAGASVFPTTGFANPTFTAIALGLRLCDHLAGGG
jgi:hypothetical protein